MNCPNCATALDPSWRLCPFCGRPLPRATRVADEATHWALWTAYHRALGQGMRPFLRNLVAAQREELAVRVQASHPQQVVAAVAAAVRGLDSIADDRRLDRTFRLAVRELARDPEHEGKIAQALGFEILALRQAIQALVDAGDIDAGVLQAVGAWLERRDRAASIAGLMTVVGFNAGAIDPISRLLARLMEKAAANGREAQWQQAQQALLAAVDRLLERVWDHLAGRSRDRGLALLDAATLKVPEQEASALWQALAEVQDSRDGAFERQHAAVHALVQARPLAPAAQRLRIHADRLAAVRAPLLNDWGTRLWIGITQGTLSRAQQEFLRLLPGDGVLAFIPTTVFGQGKAGLAFTTSSVQWQCGEGPAVRLGYAALRELPISASPEALFIAGLRVDNLDGDCAIPCAEALRACMQLCIADPGPADCRCGAPGCWLEFGDERARCRGCGRHVEYA
ncbi:hypothetical protein G6O69_28150 [Pseudenhygromyxa sp. WMMC2535]|uniref:zinc ribbon domain-containing protein n=1 Tax=Pseudenhygromyxa sp. WMMC2535 TaxID=2712867 RepID=UPI001551B135|nr:zinc ribbon domain-containing protein [Pseudenhygromyxa sp. WMMC2535]NVB41739.1 hypothetical protein [Pseudenhygromyxa sp. WMMC2535]